MSNTITIEFLVKAQKWEDVIKIFKNELGIHKGKRDASVRDVNGLFFVEVKIDDKKLTEKFYKNVKKSSKLAIIENPKDEKLRNTILNEIYKVETHLRKLLLNISDIVENFYLLFKNTYADKQRNYIKKKGKESTIVSGEIDPISSHLTLEDIIEILGRDISWNNRNITANDISQILEESNNINDVKKFLKQKMMKNTIWDEISKTLLEQTIRWEIAGKDLNRLKILRNKAAHFNVLMKKDLKDTKELSKKILETTKTKSTVTTEQITALQEAIYPNYQEMLLSAIRPLTELSESYREQPAKASAQVAAFIRAAQTEELKEAVKTFEQYGSLLASNIPESNNKKSDDSSRTKPTNEKQHAKT
ncbi:hypothetical protein KJ713_00880 [Patescibacteria group bacterium]|nr:hypothetical protein [Patescibacteria group bacterium]